MLRRKGQPEEKCQEGVRSQRPGGEGFSCPKVRMAEATQN